MERGPNGVRTSLRGGGRAQGPGDAARGLWVGQQGLANASSNYICTYMEGGPNGARTSLRGTGGVQGPRDAARGPWAEPQVSANRVQHP
jgi:hypothetical protein